MTWLKYIPQRPFLAGLLICCFAAGADAQSLFEKLVMPGKLIEGHAKLEKNCKNCHLSFTKKAQNSLCLDCHKKVAVDVRDKLGFHGRSREVKGRECKHCHTDHIGREADIVLMDAETFDHKITDFALVGAHKQVSCESCHKPGKKFRDTPSSCVDCHKKQEPHKQRLGKKCESCHSEKAWRPTKPFDHSKTKFPLKDAHKKVSCKSCHIGELYKDLPAACIDCHGLQDVHQGRNGKKCEKCHSSKDWKTVRFDHDKDTKFPLKGSHRKIKCASCHTVALARKNPPRRCVGCHGKSDPHKGQLGKKCARCHNESGWRQNVFFDHDLSRFPLIGLHAVVPCGECHVTASFKDAPLNCNGCHKPDNFHKGRLGARCQACHNPNSWQRWQFDHDRRTGFRLTGSHRGLDCHACHKRKNVKSVKLPKTCFACHKNDDVHRGAFGRNCARCHRTKKFTPAFIGR